ncbi:uncharacterized protein DUF1572 [Laceyella sediminis]|uniref:Uncharacterized protein DUF1572 n=1 Tax=Laceyella sediminis TaxID=573074 RepID=A0ABX5EQM1_9BACL|nr:DUF1572 family protein [Laceyella sediminis]PRZ15814.1 uncharacterized protein DUF1572 [Laceyella sediminis]
MDIGQAYLAVALDNFLDIKRMGERVLAQLNDEEINVIPADESNSIAIIVKHLVGNMRSRWSDFLTTDGEKPTRNREAEFEGGYPTLAAMKEEWKQGWQIVLDTVESLTPDDLLKTVTIRGQKHTVIQAIQRQVVHYSGHIGQMVYIGKWLKRDRWQSLSIPRGQSQTYLEEMLRQAEKETDSVRPLDKLDRE